VSSIFDGRVVEHAGGARVPIWRFTSAGDQREDCVQIVSLLLADVRQFDADAKNGAPAGCFLQPAGVGQDLQQVVIFCQHMGFEVRNPVAPRDFSQPASREWQRERLLARTPARVW
jgi:hypothetical protein